SGGCLNYGHSCLGAHGKRASAPPHRPLVPRPLLDILDALTTPTRTNNLYAHTSDNSMREPRTRNPEGRFLAPSAGNQLADLGLDLRADGLMDDINEEVDIMGGISGRGGRMGGSDERGERLGGSSEVDPDAVLYYGTLDDYNDVRYKRQASPGSAAVTKRLNTWAYSPLQQEEEQEEEEKEEEEDEQQKEEEKGRMNYDHQHLFRLPISKANWWRR
ncbi:hypothetical protein OTU49_009890, partial [Cherax quadricarinatus]